MIKVCLLFIFIEILTINRLNYLVTIFNKIIKALGPGLSLWPFNCDSSGGVYNSNRMGTKNSCCPSETT